VYKAKNQFILIAALLVVAVTGSSAWANVDPAIGPPSATKRLLTQTALNIPQFKRSADSLYCLDTPEECGADQPKKTALIVPAPMPKPAVVAPPAPKSYVDRIPLGSAKLAPMAHTLSCLQYPADCVVRKASLRTHDFELTPARWNDLIEVNAKVNHRIRPQRNTQGLAAERWLIDPKAGDCNDYAVTKRHDLLARGWPSDMLLLAEVVTHWGEHHLILVVRTNKGDYLLDSLRAHVDLWSKARYDWVRVQSPKNPRWWMAVGSPEV
jgi:predicted transglutaminase-like cysteine proteinase